MENNEHKELIVVFSAGADIWGNPNKETKERFKRSISFFQKRKKGSIIFAEDVPYSIFSKEKEGNYLRNINKILRSNGISPNRTATILPTLSTAAEINGVIIFLKTHSEYGEIYFVSSWYHVPRIMFMWLCRGKLAHPIPVWVDECNLLARIIAEFPKLFLAITPASFQDWLVKRMFKKGGSNI